jgi:exodeoxyribonuclease VII large subunit
MARDAFNPGADEAGHVESVSEFTRRVKTVLETGIRPGWVRGEVSNLRAQASGHVYFSLKDAGAQLACVLFRGDALRQSVQLLDGLQVLAYGEVGVYEQRGQYQLIVRLVVEDGIGRRQQEFERLKRRLADEGLFDSTRKAAIPAMPRTVGFITSPTGAAVQDFIRILLRRGWRGRLVILPALVQGEGAAAEMIEMLRRAEALGLFDLLVIGRGGGSLEDLWAFNEEPLVRAVAGCSVPIISAVGHEIDFTLCDFAADVRAETPSAAAELISSSFVAARERTTRAAERITGALEAAVERKRGQVDRARGRLRLLSPRAVLEQHQLRLDDLTNRALAAVRAGLQRHQQRLTEVAGRYRGCSPEARMNLASHRLQTLGKRLRAASPASVLNRGFAMVRDEAGRPVSRRVAVAPGQRLANEFADGRVLVRVEPDQR